MYSAIKIGAKIPRPSSSETSKHIPLHDHFALDQKNNNNNIRLFTDFAIDFWRSQVSRSLRSPQIQVSDPSWSPLVTMSSFGIGQRVVTISSADAASKTDNTSAVLERGTVRYVGEVAGTKGQWIGVEWDDEGRGRHDGTHDGKRFVGW